jgi:hypothetical protein
MFGVLTRPIRNWAQRRLSEPSHHSLAPDSKTEELRRHLESTRAELEHSLQTSSRELIDRLRREIDQAGEQWRQQIELVSEQIEQGRNRSRHEILGELHQYARELEGSLRSVIADQDELVLLNRFRLEAPLAILYKIVLRRPADTSGLSMYTELLRKGTSLEQIAEIILGSDEYKNLDKPVLAFIQSTRKPSVASQPQKKPNNKHQLRRHPSSQTKRYSDVILV